MYAHLHLKADTVLLAVNWKVALVPVILDPGLLLMVQAGRVESTVKAV